MAIVVEDGTGLSNADSYQSVADAGTYIGSYMTAANEAIWAALTTAEQELACRLATQYLDAVYGSVWRGYRTNEVQALDWPRSDVYDSDGYAVDNDVLPTALLQAHAEIAFRSGNGETLLPDRSSPVGDLSKERVKVGPIEVETSFAGSASVGPKFYDVVDRLLDPIIDGSLFARVERA